MKFKRNIRSRLFPNLVWIGLAIFVVTGFAADEAIIGDVRFEQIGKHKVPHELLVFNTQSRVGKPFDENILNEDIKRLYKTGFFSDVVADTVKTPEGKVDITIKLTAKVRVKNVIFKGNKVFTNEELRDEVSVASEAPLDDEKVQKSANQLRDFYKDKGYHDATVSVEIEKTDDPHYVNVVFSIKEHLRLMIGSVTFKGNTVFSSWRLRRSIENQHSYLSWISFLNLGLFKRPELKNDKLRLRELYWNDGYLDFKVKSVKVTEDKEDPEYVDLVFDLEEGKPYKVGRVTVSGCHKFTEKEIRDRLYLMRGETYDNRIVRDDVDIIKGMYEPKGYADLSCVSERSPDYQTHTVDIDFNIDEGRVYRVRNVNIMGNSVTKDYVIRRELPLQPGDLLDNELVKVGKSRLLGLDYFKRVEAVSVNTPDPGKKDIDIKVQEKDTIKFNIGGGWSDTDSLVGMVGIKQSNFDITDPYNYFQGGGQRVTAQGMFGLDEWGGMIGFTEPWLFGIPLQLDVTGYNRNRTYDKWRENRLGTEISLTKKVFDDFTSLSMGYRFEGVRIYDMDDNLSKDLTKWKGTDLVGAFSFSVNRDTRDSFTNPSSGYAVNFLSEVTSQIFGASHNYYRLEAKGIQYFSLLDKALIFQFGGKVGTVQNIDQTGQAPLYERYFLGGGDTLRGFPFREVSPVDKNEDFIGGDTMLLFTAEMSHPIYEFLRGAVFVDAGGSFKNSWAVEMDAFNVGVGYGLRIKIPQLNYPIRLDLAYPVLNNQKGVDSKLRFHFNVGFNW